MSLFAIPNPTKELTVDFNIDEVYQKMCFLNLDYTKLKFVKKDEILKSIRFTATEFLSVGVNIDIQLSKISDDTTKIHIEVSRVIGAFDKRHEITLANDHIKKVMSGISTILTKDLDFLKSKDEEVNNQNDNQSEMSTGGLAIFAISALIFLMIVISLIS